MRPPAASIATARPALGRIVLTVFLPFAGGYFLSYLFRSVNAVIAPQLIAEIGLGAADLGLLTAAYFLSFAAIQLPLGLLLDRFGPRRVQACLLLSAASGALVFGLGHSMLVLMLGRAMIGLGVAGGLMASFKAITLWFPKERWPLVNGCFLGMGGLGAMAATQPVEALLHVTDWRGLFMGLSVVTCLASMTIFLVVPEAGHGVGRSRLGEALRGVSRVFGDRLFWRLAPAALTCSSANFAIQGLWAGPWLSDVAGFGRDTVALYLLMLAAAMTAGFVVTGVIADLLGRLGVGLVQVIAGGIVLYLLVQVVIVFEWDRTAVWPWLAFGLVGNITALAHAALARHFPIEFSGRANTALNFVIFASAFVVQYAMGAIIDLWPVAAGGGYASDAYRAAFGAALAAQVVAFAWLLLPRPTAA